MYYAANNLSELGQTSCAPLEAKLDKLKFLASAEGGRGKEHQKEAATAATKVQVQLNACQVQQQEERQDFTDQVQRFVSPAPTAAASRWVWLGVLGAVAIVGFTAYRLRKRKK
jgi:hypothetical protein